MIRHILSVKYAKDCIGDVIIMACLRLKMNLAVSVCKPDNFLVSLLIVFQKDGELVLKDEELRSLDH